MKDLISIIIPAYNIENEIERCVNSVLAQTYSNIEVIIVNDGSKDGTLNVLQRLESTDSRIRVIDKSNAGVTKARLTGVAAAKGEWIGFVDGDDYIEPEMYEHLLNNAEKYEADISHWLWEVLALPEKMSGITFPIIQFIAVISIFVGYSCVDFFRVKTVGRLEKTKRLIELCDYLTKRVGL